MGCPQCQSDDISDSGICRACGYVTSINAGAEESVPRTENSESASADENAEFQNHSGLIEVDYSEGESKEELEEERPAWRQELSQRLQAIKQKREAMEQSRQTETRDHKPSISLKRNQTGKPPIPYMPGSLELPPPVRKPVPKSGTPLPKQKTLQPLSSGLSPEKLTRKETERDVQALIDNAVSGKALQPSDPVMAAGFPDSDEEMLLDDEGKLILLSRTLSGLVDLIIVVLCSGICIIAADFFSGIISLDAVSYLIFSVLFLLTYFFYSLFFLAASNQTVGMMITDLHVVDADGKRPSISQLLRRCFGHLASVLVLGSGLLWSLFDRNSQCFHDRISDTRVLRLY
jgi:uncharacterized RDD family membrane protein YckC